MNELQEIINRRAAIRAEKEIQKFCEIFSNLRELSEISKAEVTFHNAESSEETKPLRAIFWNVSESFAKLVIAELTAKYEPLEAQKFVKEVADLREATDELFGEVEELRQPLSNLHNASQ